MDSMQLLFAVSLVFLGLIFLYLLWLHSKIRRLSIAVDRLKK
ncbi:MAG: hypothetical protein QXT81_02680 [Candidatus Bathyarchaeia archaeon]